MTKQEAIDLIREGWTDKGGSWADLGAGTGVFTLALSELLESGTIYAVDKNPHVLWSLPGSESVKIRVEEADFTRKMDLPVFDGILMANALHYAKDPVAVLQNVLQHLKPQGTFILIEYETQRAISPWVPYPIPFHKFVEIAKKVNLSKPSEIGRIPSSYGYDHIYAAKAKKN